MKSQRDIVFQNLRFGDLVLIKQSQKSDGDLLPIYVRDTDSSKDRDRRKQAYIFLGHGLSNELLCAFFVTVGKDPIRLLTPTISSLTSQNSPFAFELLARIDEPSLSFKKNFFS